MKYKTFIVNHRETLFVKPYYYYKFHLFHDIFYLCSFGDLILRINESMAWYRILVPCPVHSVLK